MLIKDRTYQDCERAEQITQKMKSGKASNQEKEEYISGLRGCYNMVTDWNRVEKEVKRISDLLGLGLDTKTDWAYDSIQTSEEITRYLGNIETIRSAVSVPDDTPETPLIESWININSANDIEKILQAAANAVGYDGIVQRGDSIKITKSVSVSQAGNKLYLSGGF